MVRPSLDPAAWVFAISRLLGLGRPFAVPGLIVPVAVDAVDSHSVRPCAHVGKEIPEGQPPFADSDAPAAISRIRGVPRVIAPGHHPVPGMMGARVTKMLGGAVRELACHLLPGLLGKLRARLVTDRLAAHRMIHARAVAADVFADAISALVHGRVLAASARAKLRYQRRPVLLMPFRLGDLPLGLLGVVTGEASRPWLELSCVADGMPAARAIIWALTHSPSLYQVGEYS